MAWRMATLALCLGLGLGACGEPRQQPEQPAAEAAPPLGPPLAAPEVRALIAAGDPYGDAEGWARASTADVRFVEYTRSVPVVGAEALAAYLAASAKARRGLRRVVVQQLVLGDSRVAVRTRILDDDGATVGASLSLVTLGDDGLVHELRTYGQPEPWPGTQVAAADPVADASPTEGAADPQALQRVRQLLDAEGTGGSPDVAVTFEPSDEAVDPGDIMLPAVPGGAWTNAEFEHPTVVGAGPWVVALSRVRTTLQPHDIPMVLHRALVVRVDAGRIAEVHAYVDPLEVGPVAMDFRSLGGRAIAESETGGKVYGPKRAWCCRQGDAEAVECWMQAPGHDGRCRRAGWREYACRHRQGCVGDNCFCCDNGIDAACEPEPKKKERPRETGWGRSRRAQGTIWSPY